MIYGMIVGLSLIAGALVGEFWWGAFVGLAMGLSIFLWKKYGGTVRSWSIWHGSPAVRMRMRRIATWPWKKKKWVLWPLFLGAVIWFIGTYQGRADLARGFYHGSSIVNGGEYVEYQLDTLKPKEFTAPAVGRWKFEVVDQKEYRYKCPGWKGEGSGYLKKVHWKDFIYGEPITEYPYKEKGHPGALLIYSEASRDNPLPSGQEFIVGGNKKYFIEPNLTQGEKKCDVIISAPVKFVLRRVE